MKQKIYNWSKAILTACMGLGWLVGFDFVSAFFLGEYPYPQENND